MSRIIRKNVFGDKVKSEQAPHIFLILFLFLVVSTIYYFYLFSDFRDLAVRITLSVLMIAAYIGLERSPLSTQLTAFLSPAIIMILIKVGILYYGGDFLIFTYSIAGAMISLTYMKPRGMAYYIITVSVLQISFLIFEGGNIMGPRFTYAQNYTAFLVSVGLNVVILVFCKTYTQISNSKEIFLSNISHEIRTPISAVLGISEIELQDDQLQDSTRNAFIRINNSGKFLLRIINDILDASKLKGGTMSIVKSEYNTAALINDISNLPYAHLDKDVEFRLVIDDHMPAYLIGDAARISQTVTNILSNAFKYTEQGLVLLHISYNQVASTLVFTVEDSGVGMTKKQVDNIFVDYARFHEKELRTIGGAGLGMSIVYKLVLLMDGQIKVNSTVNKGTNVTLTLPQKTTRPELLSNQDIESLVQFEIYEDTDSSVKAGKSEMPHAKVLVVDDLEINLYVASGLLAHYDIDAETCLSGIATLEKVRAGNVYDIIFLDYMMPELDGIETMLELRKMGYSKPVVALTADAIADNNDKFMSAGFSDFISKPIDTNRLYSILQKYIPAHCLSNDEYLSSKN